MPTERHCCPAPTGHDPEEDPVAVAATTGLKRIEQAARNAQVRALRRTEELLDLTANGLPDAESAGASDPTAKPLLHHRRPGVPEDPRVHEGAGNSGRGTAR